LYINVWLTLDLASQSSPSGGRLKATQSLSVSQEKYIPKLLPIEFGAVEGGWQDYSACIVV
jgi:hypothetical protein